MSTASHKGKKRRKRSIVWHNGICNENPQHTIVERVKGSRTLSDYYTVFGFQKGQIQLTCTTLIVPPLIMAIVTGFLISITVQEHIQQGSS